jgi:hypothetical protein
MSIAGRLVRLAAWSLVVGAFSAHAYAAAQPVALDVQSSARLQVSGDVAGLAPGQPGTLNVRIVNPSDVPATIHGVSVTVLAPAGRRDCPAGLLRVTPHSGVTTISAGGEQVVPLSVRFAADLPEACARASWRLDYATN